MNISLLLLTNHDGPVTYWYCSRFVRMKMPQLPTEILTSHSVQVTYRLPSMGSPRDMSVKTIFKDDIPVGLIVKQAARFQLRFAKC